MTPEELEAVEALEKDAAKLRTQLPQLAGRVAWVCRVARRLNATEPAVDPREAVMANQAARIVELELRLGLTPDAVLAAERAELS